MTERTATDPASSAEWTAVIDEDTGELLDTAAALGAATALLDEAIWTPMSVPPDGVSIPGLHRSSPRGTGTARCSRTRTRSSSTGSGR